MESYTKNENSSPKEWWIFSVTSLLKKVVSICCPALCLCLRFNKISAWCLSQQTGLLFNLLFFNDWVSLWSQIQRVVSPCKLSFQITQFSRERTEWSIPLYHLFHLLTQKVQRLFLLQQAGAVLDLHVAKTPSRISAGRLVTEKNISTSFLDFSFGQ